MKYKKGTFWQRVNKTTNCWLWTASKTSAGYGHLSVDGNVIYAHRYSYELTNGMIPKGSVIDHLCRIPACVNPSHLEAVDYRTNVSRGNIHINRKFELPLGVDKTKSGRFLARIRRNGRLHRLGLFNTAQEAHNVYVLNAGI